MEIGGRVPSTAVSTNSGACFSLSTRLLGSAGLGGAGGAGGAGGVITGAGRFSSSLMCLASASSRFDDALLDLRLLTPVAHHRRGHLAHHVVRLAQLCDQLLAFGAGTPPAAEEALDQLQQVERDLAGDVHHLEPGKVGKDRQPEQEERQQGERAALHVERLHRQLAKAFAQRTA